MNITRYIANEEQLSIFQNHVNVTLLGCSHLSFCLIILCWFIIFLLNYFITFELNFENSLNQRQCRCPDLHKFRARLQTCTWRTRKWRYTCTKIRPRYWLLYATIIWICQCVVSSSRSSYGHTCYLSALRWFCLFFCFYRKRFCSLANN